MICLNCLRAGEENQAKHYKRAAHWHEKCEKCECQHKTGQGWVEVVKAALKPTLSP